MEQSSATKELADDKEGISEMPVKRQRIDEDKETPKSAEPKVISSVRRIMAALSSGDIVPALGLNEGDRLQVLWILEDEEAKDEEGAEPNLETEGVEHWWACTLRKRLTNMHRLHDNTDDAEIAVYELAYDPLENNVNYSTETLSSVCFLGEESLYDIEYNKVLKWRLLADDVSNSSRPLRNPVILDAIQRFARNKDIETFEKQNMFENLSNIRDDEVIPIPEGKSKQASEQLVNAIISSVIAAHSSKMNSLPASTQYSMADKVIAVKRILIQKIAECLDKKKILDAEAVKEIIADITPTLRKMQDN